MSSHWRSRREFLRDAGLAFGGPLLAAGGTSGSTSTSGIAKSGGKPSRAKARRATSATALW